MLKINDKKYFYHKNRNKKSKQTLKRGPLKGTVSNLNSPITKLTKLTN
jgi:hypothetical protein